MQSADIINGLLSAFDNAERVDYEIKNLPQMLVAVAKISDLLDIQSDYNRSAISFSLAVLEENREDQITSTKSMNDLNSKTSVILSELFNILLGLITAHLRAALVTNDGVEGDE